MAKRKVGHKRYNWCGFGKHDILDGQSRRHVHPIPACEAFPDGGTGGDGATACGECYPEIERLQIAQGILLVQ